MKTLNTSRVVSRVALRCALLSPLLLLIACSSSESSGSAADFELQALPTTLELTEGDSGGLNLPFTLTRRNDHDSPVTLSIEGLTPADDAFITSSFDLPTMEATSNSNAAVMRLDIADLPIMRQQRSFTLVASDGIDQHELKFQVAINPVDAPDIYLLVGQSNMVGFSGEGTRQSYAGGLDATDPRIQQLNATSNNQDTIFVEESDFTAILKNVATPSITVAEDPLHVPLDATNTQRKSLDYIGLGLSFAKAALNDTSNDIILVPAAWSGSAFCANDQGPPGQWNAQDTTDAALGNTWLFDRAVARADYAIQTTGGILRGVLWHQGESDANDACASSYAANLERLVQALRLTITADARGGDLRRNDSNIPFVVGTMSRGIDDRGDLSQFSQPKELIDLAHRNLPNVLNSVALSNHDDLTPANGYPCGNGTCVHFGAEALREMGRRYYAALLRASGS